MEATSILISFQRSQIPPTAGFTNPDPEMPDINLVTGASQDWEPGPSMSNSFGFGGHNGCLVLAPVDT
jgi:3-oxoacyl-[acyl-carrier-protein] synthase II